MGAGDAHTAGAMEADQWLALTGLGVANAEAIGFDVVFAEFDGSRFRFNLRHCSLPESLATSIVIPNPQGEESVPRGRGSLVGLRPRSE